MVTNASSDRVEAVAFVLNPTAGDGTATWVYPQAAEILRRRGVQIACFETLADGAVSPPPAGRPM
ncbi:MAG: hypothetical protein J7M38_14160, partial [Armatimonadetes bacterium]|nr:hypothetical protein [Armatimonadota bacterium]